MPSCCAISTMGMKFCATTSALVERVGGIPRCMMPIGTTQASCGRKSPSEISSLRRSASLAVQELGHETRNEVYKAPKIGVVRAVVGEKLADVSIPESATIGMDTIAGTN